MSLSAILLIVVLLATMILGIPMAWSLLLASLAAFFADGSLPLALLAQRVFVGADSFPILAVPAFIVAGDIMSEGGISKRLIEFADTIVGGIAGGLAHVSIVASTIFAALTGSAIATTAAIGGLMYPEMEKRGYPKPFSAAVQSIGGTLGPVIPPSIVFIFYATSTNTSVSQLLMSGVLPGVLSCLCLCFVVYVIAVIKKFPKEGKFSFKRFFLKLKDAVFALLMPVIILGGIYSGIFTPTESAGVAVIYGLIVVLFIYKDIKIRDLPKLFKKSAVSTANMYALLLTAQLFGWMAAYYNIPNMAAKWVMSIAHSPTSFMLLVVLVLIIAGMFMEASSIIVIIAPILAPIAAQFGIHPIHFGCLVVFTLCIGIATPPFGPTTFVACSISGEPIMKVGKALIPFILCQICIAILIVFVPWLATALI